MILRLEDFPGLLTILKVKPIQLPKTPARFSIETVKELNDEKQRKSDAVKEKHNENNKQRESMDARIIVSLQEIPS